VTVAPTLVLDQVGRRLAGREVVRAISLELARGEVLGLLGVNGAGKTTTLRMIAGFVPPTSGDVRLDGASITALPPHRREMGIVFQREG